MSSDSESVEQVVEEGMEEEDEDDHSDDDISDDTESEDEIAPVAANNQRHEVVEEEESEESEISESEDESDSDREYKKKNSPNRSSSIGGTTKKTKTTTPMSIAEKYKNIKGKQLVVVFPSKLPTDPMEFEKKVKELHKSIVKVIRPRQKTARHCSIEFASETERTLAHADIKNMKIDGKKLIVHIPKTDDDEFVKVIVEKKTIKTLKNREKMKLKRLARNANKKKEFTSTLNITNIPSTTTATQIKELFPSAIDFQFTCAKGTENTSKATVTLPTPRDATLAYKTKNIIGGNELKVNFAVSKQFKTPEQLETLKLKNKAKKLKKKNKNADTGANNNSPIKTNNKRKLGERENGNKKSPVKKSKGNNTVDVAVESVAKKAKKEINTEKAGVGAAAKKTNTQKKGVVSSPKVDKSKPAVAAKSKNLNAKNKEVFAAKKKPGGTNATKQKQEDGVSGVTKINNEKKVVPKKALKPTKALTSKPITLANNVKQPMKNPKFPSQNGNNKKKAGKVKPKKAAGKK